MARPGVGILRPGHDARGLSLLGIDAVPGGDRHVPVALGAAEDDLAQRHVVAGVGLVQDVLGVGDDLDVVGAVLQVGDVERLARHGLQVGVAPAGGQALLHPQGGGEPHWPPKPKVGGCQAAPGSVRSTWSVGAMQKPTLPLLTITFLPAPSSSYSANCWKCKWSWPFLESN